MTCPSCGAQTPDQAAFCPACGKSIAASEPAPVPTIPSTPAATKPGRRTPLWQRLVGGAVGLTIALVVTNVIRGTQTSVTVGSSAHGFTVSGVPRTGVNYVVIKDGSAFNTSALTVELLKGSNASGWSTVSTQSETVLPNDNEYRMPFIALTSGTYQIAFLNGSAVLGSATFKVP